MPMRPDKKLPFSVNINLAITLPHLSFVSILLKCFIKERHIADHY